MIDDLMAAYRNVVADGCRAILLRSSMRHFSAGAQIEAIGTTTLLHKDQARLREFWDALEDVPVPTVAAVHGGVLGGGLELALTCDMIIAADTAFLGQVEMIIGLLPLLGGTQRLAQRCGAARAKEIALLGRRQVPEAELPAASMATARQLAAGPTLALKGIKKQANLAARGGVAFADAQQVEINDAAWNTADRERGIAAFFATGPASAVFKGD
jgi:enoyl-CoA hydratase/carnithine racemase